MEKRRHANVNVLMCAVAVLLCATLYTTHLVGGLYARYTTSGSSSDSARVAAFNIEQEGTLFETVQAPIAPGKTEYATLTINNKSEVAVQCDVAIDNVTKNLPDTMKVTLKVVPKKDAASKAGTPADASGSGEPDADTSAVQIAAGESVEYMLNINWPSGTENDKEDLDIQKENLASMGMVDYVTISVTATQID